MLRGYIKIVIFVLATTLHLVAGKNHNNCNLGSNCSPIKAMKNSSTRHLLTKERHHRAQSKIHLNFTKYQSDKQRGYKRDSTFAEVLMNLLSKVDNAKRKVVQLNSPPQAKAKPVISPAKKPASNAVDASKTTPAPITSVPPSATTSPTASSTTGGSTTGSPGSEATTAIGSTVTTSPSPTPTITVTPSPNVSCNATLGPCTTSKPPVKPDRYNITIAPGIILTPNGQIVLNPQFPLLIGGSQTSGAKPIPGISVGAAQLPGIVSGSSGTVAGGHVAAGQPGPCINRFKDCIDWASKGECWKNKPFMIANCRRSCTNCAKCENKETQCVEWAKHGECRKNWQFMEQKCWRSCSRCAPCQNKFPEKCIMWAKDGECPLNRHFMEKQCWKSCSSCAKCENKHLGCVEWAASGHCFKNPPFMLMNCWKSCSFCAPCVDKHPNRCPLWAKYGECKKNKAFMEENCWKSCSKCCKDKSKHCESWAKQGECIKNPDFMTENCAKSCNKC